MNRLLNLSSISQQNSLYGSSFDHLSSNQQQQQQQGGATSVMSDFANLQFDNSPMNAIGNMSQQQQQQLALGQDSKSKPQRAANQHHHQTQSGDNSQATNATNTANNDMSLYSPSSSTSLLYHIYDQINLPGDQQQPYQTMAGDGKHLQNQNNNNNLQKKNNTTTILNPANLFNQSPAQLPAQVQIQMHHHHQHQLSQLAEMQKQQQQCYSTYQQQQHPFSTLNPHHHAPSASSYMTTAAAALHHQQQQQQNNLMLDTVMRHHQRGLQRPLSSSAASSMSGQSIPAYGRHPRQSFMGGQHGSHNGFPSATTTSKSQNNLASVLHHANQNTLSHHHLNHPHLIFGASNGTTNSSSLSHKNAAAGGGSKMGPSGCCWPLECSGYLSKRFLSQRARHLLYEYGTIVKCSILLVILAFMLMSIIKLTLLPSASPISSAPSQPQMILPAHFSPASPSSSSNIFYQQPTTNPQKRKCPSP